MKPHRGVFGKPRPPALAGLALPPAAMPSRLGPRPLKAWRYVGAFSPELMLCLASVRVGPLRQAFFAVWDRESGRLHERVWRGRGAVALETGLARVGERDVALELELGEGPGIETVCPSGEGYAWTRKQAGIPACGSVRLPGRRLAFEGRAVVDDSAGYHERHTYWYWSAGVGRSRAGRDVAWNLVEGVNDPPSGSERTVWVDGRAAEAPPVRFATDLSAVGGLRFRAEAARERSENLLVVRSRYRQPFGTFGGTLPDGTELADGLGVMEDHDVFW